ncbi:hypothetical protein [Mesorhizobium sp.]|uniref:hypothetical protein n=1 Tax=Mesorhizobium sp. TaxID=1871066 RepID=UPI000FE68A35|nr:hypothetical protein [Mesorhizobium sp.]RWF33767.1 MAG: hypothetical protein EOS45_02215 [Mesorhizobium sp.]
MSTIVRNEFAGQVFGVAGRFHNVVLWADGATFANQHFTTEARPVSGYGKGATIRAELRFDDNPRNGHNTFAITGEVRDPSVIRDRGIVACGCVHDEIAKAFPELAPLIRWHLTSTDGPMHYAANAVFLAGNRDHWGKLAGEVSATETVVRFGDNPISHRLKKPFLAFLQSAAEINGQGRFDFEVIAVAYENKRGASYDFKPKYTFGGYGVDWYGCPFDSEREALEFLGALQRCNPHFDTVATAWGEGKARDLDAARRAAIWPEASDAELSVEPEALKAALAARLPALIAEFRRDMETAGFLWQAA